MPEVEVESEFHGPGVRPDEIFDALADEDASRLLPSGSLELIAVVSPDRVEAPLRSKTLGQVLSVELAVDDPTRRVILLRAVPQSKRAELEERVGSTIDALCQVSTLDSVQRRALLGFFGFSKSNDRPRESTPSTQTISPERGLFPFQKRAAISVERLLYRDGNRAMLHLPTGAGKTRTAMSVVGTHLRRFDPALVLWLAGTRELLEQAAEEFESTWQVVGDREVDCVRFWGDHDPNIDEISDGIIFAGLGKLRSFGKCRERLWALGDRTTMVVFDEAHQALATTYQDTVETIATRNVRTPLLGLSATPGRTWADLETDAALADMFQGNKVTIECDGQNPIRYLTENGYLAAVSFSSLNVEPGLRLSSVDIEEISRSLDIPDHLAEQLGVDTKRNLRIVQRILEATDRHDRVLVFGASVDNALLIASICRGVGVSADVVTANTDAGERDRVIRRFRRRGGGARILVNYGVLTAGFDAPAASAVLIARPTKSLVLYSQMVGRVIRGPRSGGAAACEVITVVDRNLPGFGSVAEAFRNWEDVWQEHEY